MSELSTIQLDIDPVRIRQHLDTAMGVLATVHQLTPGLARLAYSLVSDEGSVSYTATKTTLGIQSRTIISTPDDQSDASRIFFDDQQLPTGVVNNEIHWQINGQNHNYDPGAMPAHVTHFLEIMTRRVGIEADIRRREQGAIHGQ